MAPPRIDQRVGQYHRADAEYCRDPEASFNIDYPDPVKSGLVHLTCCDPADLSYVDNFREERPATPEEVEQCLLKQNAKQNWFEREDACPGTEESAEVEYTQVSTGQTTRVICCSNGADHAVLDENQSVPVSSEHQWVCEQAADKLASLRQEAKAWREGKMADRIPYAIETAGDGAIPPFVRTVNRLWLPKTNLYLELSRRDEETDLMSLLAHSPFHGSASAVLLTGIADRRLSMEKNSIEGVLFKGVRVLAQGIETVAPACFSPSLEEALVSVRIEGPETESGLQEVTGAMVPVLHDLERYSILRGGPKKEQQITHDRLYIDPLLLTVTSWVVAHPNSTPPEVLAALSEASHDIGYSGFNKHDGFPPAYRLETLGKVFAASTNPSCSVPTVFNGPAPLPPTNPDKQRRASFSSYLGKAAKSLDEKLRNFLENNGLPVPKNFPLVSDKGGTQGESMQEAEDGSTLSGYLLAAFAELIQKQTGTKVCIPDLETLDRLLEFQEGEGLLYHSGEISFYLDPFEVANLLLGRVNVLGDKITLGSYSFYDFNGDGVIRLGDDLIEKREMLEETRYDAEAAKTKNVLLSRKRFANLRVFSEVPDFLFNGYEADDVQQAFKQGVPLAEMRQFADPTPANLHIVKISPDPLADDGKYRVLIHRYRPGEYWGESEPGSAGMAAFERLNGFDDVYAFAENEGYLMEDALDRVAARGIPYSDLYIGTHGDAAGLNVALDFDHPLQMAEGGRVVFTGCEMNKQHAAYLGSLLSGGGSGTMLWGSGINVPLPFGGLFSWKGDEFESQIQAGRVIKTVKD